ncbi:penicillin-binding protein 1C [Thalassococcus sp. CAU 1522]|uniref:Penicillin-binding protein 1C n=1 Tax=Thalassococcus arenae TaxID=2851652 RepID=A0ABS6N5F6_9RHOB|nr:penicillin-binding protein 1C [Thalassococcus arenae]MBV2359241.1 penicillin-binding protein 1C [Thalassococcus arenae]
MRSLLVLVVLLWGAAITRDRAESWVDGTVLPPLVHATGAEIRDRNGALLRAYTVEDGRWRLDLPLDRVDPLFLDMLVAYEDKRFFRHNGVDPLAVLRAGWQALRNGRAVSGASTLTMQVARLLEDSGTGTWQGKLRQARLALALERQLSKDEILGLYLRLAPYGGNVEGLRAASLIWLGREPVRLTPAQAALLVALPQAPETRRPDRFPQAARLARDRVLQRSAKAGVIDADTVRASLRDPVPNGRHPMPKLAPHLSDRVMAQAQGRHDLMLDADLQSRLEALADEVMRGHDPRLSIAIIVADHENAEILASVGSAAYASRGQGFVDMTNAKRSPGSTLKPLVYGLAFDRGLAHPETLILDAPVQFGRYAPQNFDGVFRGDVRIARALQLSLNIPVVRLTQAMGPAHLMAALRDAGLSPELPPGGAPGLAVSLGGVGLSLEELVTLYAALAQQGQARALRWNRLDPPTDPVSIMSRAAAWQVGHILADLAPPPTSGKPGQVAYKTGTSYGHRDAWAIGWDGRYVAGVWIGRPDGTPVPGAFGGDLAAPVLFQALARARAVPVALPPPPPDALLVSGARLPPNLQRFGAAVQAQAPLLHLAFPPDGARLPAEGAPLTIKLRGGIAPYTLLADGRVLATGLRRTQITGPRLAPGYTALSVIDASGQSASVTVEAR